MKSKQVIVMRKDLNMRKGKMVAQGSHASMKSLLDLMHIGTILKSPYDSEEVKILTLVPSNYPALDDWIFNKFRKITVTVDSEEELMEIYNKAKAANLHVVLIVDAGLTEFGGVPTKTCIAIGPAWDEEVDKITGHLKLL